MRQTRAKGTGFEGAYFGWAGLEWAPPVGGFPGSVPPAVDPLGEVLEALDGGGVLGIVPDDDEDAAPPGTTVVVSLRSHADNASAPISTSR